MKTSELILERLEEAKRKFTLSGEREHSYWSGVVAGLESAYDVARLQGV